MNLTVHHQIGKDAAVKRLKDFSINPPRDLSTKISNLNVVWNGNEANFNFDIAKTKIKGKLQVLESADLCS